MGHILNVIPLEDPCWDQFCHTVGNCSLPSQQHQNVMVTLVVLLPVPLSANASANTVEGIPSSRAAVT